MACDFITKGKKATACMDSIGGVKNYYFALWGNYGITVVNGEVTSHGSIGAIEHIFKYEVTGNANSLTETLNPSMENMTSFVTQVTSATFQGLNKDLQVQLSLLAKSRTLVFIEDYNGNIKLMGLTNGAYGSAGTAVTGAAKGDLSGYTIELTAEEKEFAPFLSSDSKAELFAAVEDTYVS